MTILLVSTIFHSNENDVTDVCVCVTKETYDDIKRNAKAPTFEALN